MKNINKIIFKGEKPYEALGKAQKYLIANGYSFGVEDGKNPIGIKRGDFIIQRWINIKDKEILDGVMESKDFRGKKVIIYLKTEV